MKSLKEILLESHVPAYQVKKFGNIDCDEPSKSLLSEFFKFYGDTLKVISGNMTVDSGNIHIEFKNTPKMLDISYNHHNQQAMVEGESFSWNDFQKMLYSKKNWLIQVCEKYKK